MKTRAVILMALLLGLPVGGICQSNDLSRETAPPATPAAIKGILVAQPFTLTTPFDFVWIKEKPRISSGTLVVLEVDKALVVPRNMLEPVLFAGDSTVMRLNHGHLSGRVIGIVPPSVDLTTAPMWFGTPDLPERVTAETVAAERAKAEKTAIRPLPATQLSAARRAPASAKDLATLLRTTVADLVLEFSPEEKSLAEIWRLPVAKPPPSKKANEPTPHGSAR